MSETGERLISAMHEAVAIAKGEQPAARIWHQGFAYVPEDQWQDIATAPKDGTWVIVYCPSYVHERVRAARYTDDVGLGEPIWDFSGEGYEYHEGEEAPTHWMPLPAPPTHADPPTPAQQKPAE